LRQSRLRPTCHGDSKRNCNGNADPNHVTKPHSITNADAHWRDADAHAYTHDNANRANSNADTGRSDADTHANAHTRDADADWADAFTQSSR
jgi:hypothetical protein